MTAAGQRARLLGRGRAVFVLAIATIVCDGLVAFTAYQELRTFSAAPNNAFVAPGDDGSYFAAGAGFAAASALRYLELAGLVVAVVRCRRRSGHPKREPGRASCSGPLWSRG